MQMLLYVKRFRMSSRKTQNLHASEFKYSLFSLHVEYRVLTISVVTYTACLSEKLRKIHVLMSNSAFFTEHSVAKQHTAQA